MILDIAQIVIGVILIILILVQNRGTGLGAAFGGEGNVYRTKRGLEKKLFILTVILAVAFLVVAALNSLAGIDF